MLPAAAAGAQSAHPKDVGTGASKGKSVSARPLVDIWDTGYLVNLAHRKCLDAVRSHDGQNGDAVQLWSCNSGSNQVWTFDDLLPNEIYNAAHGKCLDAVRSHDGQNGDKIQLYSCNDGINQSWFASTYFRNEAHDKCLDAPRSHDGQNGDQMQLYSCNYATNQSWTWVNAAQMKQWRRKHHMH
jgi:hypothetical protein